jgi:hypothetical protein
MAEEDGPARRTPRPYPGELDTNARRGQVTQSRVPLFLQTSDVWL